MKIRAVWAVTASMVLGLLTVVSGAEQVGQAAVDPGLIESMVAPMNDAEAMDFAAKVMDAVAGMPISPRRRVLQMNAVAEAFLAASPEGRQAGMLATLIGSVPPQMLPAWFEAFKPTAGALTADLDTAAHAAFTSKVLQAVDTLDLNAEEKTIYTTFAIALLARDGNQEELDTYLAAVLVAVPSAYRDEVAAAAPAALAGDYVPLLGPDAAKFNLVTPDPKRPPTVSYVGELATGNNAYYGKDESIFIGVGLERPPIFPMPPTEAAPVATPPPVRPPVIPPPYQGQF